VSQRSPSTLSLERNGAVLHVTLNRPQQRNAMSLPMVEELIAALKEAERDKVRIVVLRGAGGHFSAGADLKDMAAARASPIEDGKDPVAETNAAFGHLCAAYARSPLAIIAILEGAVMGGGFGLSCCSDVAIAAKSVDFRLPETSLGVIPAQIAPFLVERVGYSEAKRLAVTGARFGAVEALRIGLVHLVCDGEDDIAAALRESIRQILACAPGAIGETKKLLRRARLEDPASLVDHAASVFASAARGAEGEEGLKAFVEKRKPGWAQESGT